MTGVNATLFVFHRDAPNQPNIPHFCYSLTTNHTLNDEQIQIRPILLDASDQSTCICRMCPDPSTRFLESTLSIRQDRGMEFRQWLLCGRIQA